MFARPSLAPALLASGLAALALSWVFCVPPGSGPDEPAHYIRAVSVGDFNLLGQPTTVIVLRAENPRQREFLLTTTRVVPVAAGRAAPASWYCTVIDHDSSGACVSRAPRGAVPARQATYYGAFAPFLYVPFGLATHLGKDPSSALTWARVASLVIATGFVLTAVWLVWDGSAASLLGVLVAVTPMVTFVSTVVSTSGAEVAGSLCLAAAAVRLWRDPTSRLGAYAGTASGLVVAVGRPLGPLWVLCGGLLLAALLRRQGLGALARAAPRRGMVLAGVVATGLVGNLAWQAAVVPPAPRSPGLVTSLVGPALAGLPLAAGEAIGVFGWQDIFMPGPAYAAWGIAFVGVLASALLVGSRREIRTLEWMLLLTLFILVAVSAVVMLPTGYQARGRHILPALLFPCVLAGEIVHRHRGRLGRAGGALGIVAVSVVAAALQVVGWYSMAHRYAVGSRGPWLFLGSAEWSPALGWLPWMVVVAVAGLAVGASTLFAMRPGLGAARR